MEINKDYTVLFNAISDVTEALEKCVSTLKESQNTAEEIYISREETPESPESEEKSGENLSDCSGQLELNMPKSLHKILAECARQEGVSVNQYCVYLLSSGIHQHTFEQKTQ